MDRRTVATALAGALLALVVVGSFLALDRTVLHWYASEGEEVQRDTLAETKFSEPEVVSIVQEHVSIRCSGEARLAGRAVYQGEGLWLVALGCGARPLRAGVSPKVGVYAVWSFREASERIIAMNQNARNYSIFP